MIDVSSLSILGRSSGLLCAASFPHSVSILDWIQTGAEMLRLEILSRVHTKSGITFPPHTHNNASHSSLWWCSRSTTVKPRGGIKGAFVYRFIIPQNYNRPTPFPFRARISHPQCKWANDLNAKITRCAITTCKYILTGRL